MAIVGSRPKAVVGGKESPSVVKTTGGRNQNEFNSILIFGQTGSDQTFANFSLQ